MKITFLNRKQFVKYTIKKHLGMLSIWLAFIVFGSFFIILGNNIKEDGLGFVLFGALFIILSSSFMLFTLPSSFIYYYEQALTKKYGSNTNAKIINKRVDDYSHTKSIFNNSKQKKLAAFLYVLEFEFYYNNNIYKSECFFEHKSTFDAITQDIELPIKFLKTNPKKVTLRRRKLATTIGISEKMCQ